MKKDTLSKYWKAGLFLAVVVCFAAFPQASKAQDSPPAEAIAACQNLSQGSVCGFTAPDGATISGTCQTIQSVLTCVPDSGSPTVTVTATSTSTVTPTATLISSQTITTSYTIVDTGQDKCYDANGAEITCPSEGAGFYGQDAQFTGNTSSYTDNGNGAITDNVTGLVWQKSPNTDGDGDIDAADKLTYTQALTYCNDLTLGSETDWRLPDIKQLYSLIDFSGADPSSYNGTDTSSLVPFIDTAYFDFAYGDTSAGERLIDAQYASSTLYVSNTANDGGSTLFGVNFADGRIKGYGLTLFGLDKTFFVICVRGNTSYGVNNFTDNGDSAITDQTTGLMWSQNDSGAGLNWEESLAWVEQKNVENYLGYNDWRLPNAKELQSIVDYTRSPDTSSSAAISSLFTVTVITNEASQTDYPFYWAGTTHAKWNGSGGSGVYVAFGRAMGYMGGWVDVHGAGAQRSDPKSGDPADYPTGNGPQGDAVRIYNYVRLVRDVNLSLTKTVTLANNPATPGETITYTIVLANNGAGDANNVTVQDNLPPGVSGSNLDWTGLITTGESLTFTLIATVTDEAGYGAIVLNTATYSYTSGSNSDTADFTVISDTTAPADPTLTTPADTSVITNTDSLTFSWSTVTDSQSGLDYYTLQVDSENDGLSIQASSDSITTTQTSYTPTNALSNGVYTWTVRAHDMVGNISTGLTATFTISATATSSGSTIYLPIVIREN